MWGVGEGPAEIASGLGWSWDWFLGCIKELDVVLKSEVNALNQHSFLWPPGGNSTGCKKKSDCIEVYKKIILLLT